MNNHQTDVVEKDVLSLGEQFRQAREALGLSLDDVSEKINLRTAILQHIENNEFIHAAIPATFMRGYVRSYGKFLKLPEHLLDTVNYGETEKNDLGKNMRAKKVVNHHSSHGRWVSYLTWLILLIVIGMTLLWWWQNHQQSTAERDNLVETYVATTQTATVSPAENLAVDTNTSAVSEPEASTVVSAPINLQPIGTEEKTTSEPSTSTEVLQSEINRIDATAEDTLATTTEGAAQTEPAPVADSVLRIEITGSSCWISVRDGNRKVLAEKEYRQGEVLTFNDGEHYSLIIGAPGNVKISYKGQDVPLNVDGRVARFRLPQQ